VKITLPDRPGTALSGKVVQIDPAGTISNRLVRYAALIAFDQVPDGLLFGQSANVAVITASADNVLYVPSTAVANRTGTNGTVTVRVNGTNVRRTVEIGLRGDVDTEIRNGLAEGDEVLTTGG
jgi:multidrug efflux pump subunit AcrA (membrane-fusion protein)